MKVVDPEVVSESDSGVSVTLYVVVVEKVPMVKEEVRLSESVTVLLASEVAVDD